MIIHKIVLDPGHGGRDPGAVSYGLRESDLNLKMGFFVKEALDRSWEGHETVMTRTEDISPANRLAETAGADRYYDLHFNAFEDEAVNGFETFRYSGRLLDPSTTKRMQKIVHGKVAKAMRGFGVRDRGKKKANYWAIRNAQCAALLIEYLFITNREGATIARGDDNLKQMAIATADGIAKDLELPERQVDTGNQWDLPDTLPKIQRAVGVKIDGRQSSMIGYLINNRTYLPALDVSGITGVKVEGKGDHIEINTSGRR